MCFIHHQRDPMLMTEIRDAPDIRNHALIARTRQYHRAALRILVEQCFHRLRPDAVENAGCRIHGWPKPVRMRMAKLDRMEHRTMAVSRDDQFSIIGHDSRNTCEIPAGASIDQIPASVRAMQCTRSRHGILQDPRRMMEVIRPGDLRQIITQNTLRYDRHAALMPRHMHRIILLIQILIQLIFQIMLLHLLPAPSRPPPPSS